MLEFAVFGKFAKYGELGPGPPAPAFVPMGPIPVPSLTWLLIMLAWDCINWLVVVSPLPGKVGTVCTPRNVLWELNRSVLRLWPGIRMLWFSGLYGLYMGDVLEAS